MSKGIRDGFYSHTELYDFRNLLKKKYKNYSWGYTDFGLAEGILIQQYSYGSSETFYGFYESVYKYRKELLRAIKSNILEKWECIMEYLNEYKKKHRDEQEGKIGQYLDI